MIASLGNKTVAYLYGLQKIADFRPREATHLLQKVFDKGELKERLAALGADPAPMSRENFGQLVRDEIAKWAKVVRESGAKVD